MEIKEFEKRTGYFPTTEEYKTRHIASVAGCCRVHDMIKLP